MNFGQRMKDIRQARNETLEQVAEGIGSTKSYVWEIENKPNARPSLQVSMGYADHFGMTLDEIAGRTVSDTGKLTIRKADGSEQTFNIIEASTE